MQLALSARQTMQYLEPRTYAPSAANRMHIRSRPAAFCAKDFLCLKTVHDAIEGAIELCVERRVKYKRVRQFILQLGLLRQNIMLPQTIFCVVHRAIKNNTVATIEGGDDDIRCKYLVNRDQLLKLFLSIRAPQTIRLQGDHAGVVDSEFAFIIWRRRGMGMKLTDMQGEFGMEYSRLRRCIEAFEIWLFENHSFRVTDSWHFWAAYVADFNLHLRQMDPPPPPGYEQLWAVGIDACLV
jgi:hypothetical protein